MRERGHADRLAYRCLCPQDRRPPLSADLALPNRLPGNGCAGAGCSRAAADTKAMGLVNHSDRRSRRCWHRLSRSGSANTFRSNTQSGWEKLVSSPLWAASETAMSSSRSAQRIKWSGGSFEGAERPGRDDQRFVQSRGHSPPRPLAQLRRRGIRNVRMGGLVQQPRPA